MLGEKIRAYRKDAKKTLNQIADATGLSTGYLSQLENNHVDPSLSALRKIAAALNLPVYLLMEDSSNEDYVTRKKNRVVMTFPDSPISFEVVSTLPNKTIIPSAMIMYFTQKSHSFDTDRFLIHDSDEIVLIEKGELTLYYGSNTIVLHAGDSALIPRNTPHRYHNHTDEITSGYVVTAPCTLPRNI